MRILLKSISVLLLALALQSPSQAQDQAAAPSAQPADATNANAPADPTQLGEKLDAIKQSLTANVDDTALSALRDQAQAIQQQAEQLRDTLSPQSDSLQAKLDVLGPPPAKASMEPADVRLQRESLNKAKTRLDAQTKQAKILSQEAQQLATQIALMRRDQFEQQLSSRTAPPLTGVFWQSLGHNRTDDLARLKWLGQDMAAGLRTAWQPPNRWPLLIGLLLALALLTVGRRLLERNVLDLSANHLPAGRLRRSAMVTAVALVSLLSVGLAAQAIYLALNWNGILDDDLSDLYKHLVTLTCFCAYMAGLARGLLSVKRPSWRLPSLSDDAAEHLQGFPWLLAGATWPLFLIERVNSTIGASLAAGVAGNGLTALVISGIVTSLLVRLGRARRALLAAGDEPAQRPLWVGVLVAGAFIAVALIWLGIITGYIAFAAFLAKQMLWSGLIIASLYVLLHLVDDLSESLLDPKGSSGQRLQEAFGVSPARLSQASAILSGTLRTILVLLALSLVLMPFRAGPGDLAGRIAEVFSSSSFGKSNIKPTDVIEGLAVCGFGFVALRLVKSWLNEKLLPRTNLDIGMKNSISTLLGYVGGVLIILIALATSGINLQSLTWIASALSVGIGFGLQAIVSNFICGLILLTERPVKVGDWVSISGVEGDIRRISVRATEILQGDRSTVIVPNSQLITSNVRNVTLGHAQGRVQIRLPMPLDTDAAKTRQLILDAFGDHSSVLDAPAPSVQLDTIDASGMTFVATGYTRSPREVAGVRSDLLFDILQRLRDAGLEMSSPQNMVITTLQNGASVSGTDGSAAPITPFNPSGG